jgi:hypothetical protein
MEYKTMQRVALRLLDMGYWTFEECVEFLEKNKVLIF